MKRNIALENENQVRELYQHYYTYIPPRIVAHLIWRASDGIYRPWVEFSEGAEEELHNLQDREFPVPRIYAFNHPTNIHDQFVSAAALLHIDQTASGNTRVLAKDPVIRGLNKFFGLGDKLGGIPAFRWKDNDGSNLITLANEKMFDTGSFILGDEQNLAIYPEGTHNKDDPSQLGKVRTGIGEIATRVISLHSKVAIMPIGIAYGRIGKIANPRHATVIAGNPFVVHPGETVEQITEKTSDRLQKVVTIAHKKHPTL